jgi:hypothetical protein
VPFIVALFSVVADEPAAGLDAPAAGGALLELAELPQAAIASTAAASPAAPQIFRILHASPHRAHELSSLKITDRGDHPFTWAGSFVQLAAGNTLLRRRPGPSRT